MEFSPYTPNIDSSILGKIQTPDILGGIQKGMALRDQMDKKKEEDKLKTDMTAATQGLDATTEQGMAQVAARLLQSGHQEQAMQIHKMAMDLHEKTRRSYTSVDGGEAGFGTLNNDTGEYKFPQAQPPASPYGDTQSMSNQAPPMISNAPMPQAGPQGMRMPQMSQPPQAAPSAPAPMPQAAPITSAAFQAKQLAAKRQAAEDAFNQKYRGKTLKENENNVYTSVDEATGLDANGNTVKAPPNPYANTRLIGSLITDWGHVRKDYESKMDGYLKAEGIVSAKTFGKSRIGDISLIDQMARAETGTKPTEAQYAEFKNNPGPLGKLSQMREKVLNNRFLTSDDVDAMMAELRSQAQVNHETYKASIAEKQQQARDNLISNPDRVVAPGGIYAAIENKYSKTWAKPDAPVTKPHPQDDAMVKWAKENPTAPGAADVLKANGL